MMLFFGKYTLLATFSLLSVDVTETIEALMSSRH